MRDAKDKPGDKSVFRILLGAQTWYTLRTHHSPIGLMERLVLRLVVVFTTGLHNRRRLDGLLRPKVK